MKTLSEQATTKVLENNLVRCMRRLKGKDKQPNTSDKKDESKLLKKLAVFYKSINRNFEGSKTVMSKL